MAVEEYRVRSGEVEIDVKADCYSDAVGRAVHFAIDNDLVMWKKAFVARSDGEGDEKSLWVRVVCRQYGLRYPKLENMPKYGLRTAKARDVDAQDSSASRWVARMRSQGLCARCGKPAAPYTLCADHREWQRKQQRAYRDRQSDG